MICGLARCGCDEASWVHVADVMVLKLSDDEVLCSEAEAEVRDALFGGRLLGAEELEDGWRI